MQAKFWYENSTKLGAEKCTKSVPKMVKKWHKNEQKMRPKIAKKTAQNRKKIDPKMPKKVAKNHQKSGPKIGFLVTISKEMILGEFESGVTFLSHRGSLFFESGATFLLRIGSLFERIWVSFLLHFLARFWSIFGLFLFDMGAPIILAYWSKQTPVKVLALWRALQSCSKRPAPGRCFFVSCSVE